MKGNLTYNETVELLKLFPEIDANVKYLKARIKDIDDQYYTQDLDTRFDGMPKKEKDLSDITQDLAVEVPDPVASEAKRCEKRIEQYYKLKSEMLKEMSKLKFLQKNIIFDKYISGLVWEQVAQRNHYCVRQCKNIRNAAIETLRQRFSDNKVISSFKIDGE